MSNQYQFTDVSQNGAYPSAPLPPTIQNNSYQQNSFQGNNQYPREPPPSYDASAQPQFRNREDHYKHLIQKYEISQEYANKLQMLQGFKLVFVFDDSSSMRSTLSDSPLNQNGTLLKATRWDELQYFANISIEIASIFDPNGSDVYFLNKGIVRNVYSTSQLQTYFASGPNGYTPLTLTLNSVFSNNIEAIREKKLLCIVVTDGEPTDNQGNTGVEEFRRCLKYRTPIDKIYISIVACTDEDDSIHYLNKWDREIKNLDVVDDYRNERQEIKKIKGPNYHFSYGDYVVKTLMGSIDPTLDSMDERTSCCSTL